MLDSAIAEAAASTSILCTRKQLSRDMSIAAIRSIEFKIQDLLGDQRLRGLPNLGTRENPFYGIRLIPSKEQTVLPVDGREVLIMDSFGNLSVAKWKLTASVETRQVTDDELVMEDLPKLIHVLIDVLDRHTFLCDKRVDEITKIEHLARKLLELTKE